ncbi:unnamed protein product [Eretmochelys imbricata]
MATRVRDRAACCGDMGERVSPRGLVRSVSQRLKYYIDVQRKEDSFDLSGASRNEAESPSFYMHPGSIAEQKCDQCLKHNFTDCKFEASLRVYTGNSEECERKLQSSPERQQEMKIIKKKLAQVTLNVLLYTYKVFSCSNTNIKVQFSPSIRILCH